jgi:hypothetical protein
MSTCYKMSRIIWGRDLEAKIIERLAVVSRASTGRYPLPMVYIPQGLAAVA